MNVHKASLVKCFFTHLRPLFFARAFISSGFLRGRLFQDVFLRACSFRAAFCEVVHFELFFARALFGFAETDI